jgi:hypothetical protein
MKAAFFKTGLNRLPFRAAAFVALVCVAILGMSGWGEWSARDASMQAAEVELVNLARSLTQHAEDSFDILDNSITGSVSRLETEGTDRDTLAKLRALLLLRKAASTRIHGIFVYDENGDWLTSSGPIGGNIGDRSYFQHHKQSPERDAFIGRPVKGNVDGEWITTLSRRFSHPDGSFAGVVIAAVSASYFSEFYRQFDIGADGAAALVSADGVVMARSPDDGSYVGRDVSGGSLFTGIRSQGSSGVHYFRSFLDGFQRLGAYQRSSRYPFVVVATRAQDEVLAPWRRAAIVRVLFVLSLVCSLR